MDPKGEKLAAKEDAIEAILDEWGFIEGPPRRDRKKAQIKEWLSNFLPSEIDDAFLILSKIQIKDDKMIRDAIALLAKEIIAIFQNDLSKVKFFPLGKSPSSSGGMYLYDFRKELSLSEDNFPYSEFKDNLIGMRALVFFDDMIGSGNQAIGFADKNLKDVGVKSYYASIFAFKDGLEKVRKQACFEKAFCGCLLTDEERAFHDKTAVFTEPNVRAKLKSLCEKYGTQLFPEHPLGYDDSQALLVFPHNTPNNTLPIIWASTENEKSPGSIPWHPIFERKKILPATCPDDLSALVEEIRQNGSLLEDRRIVERVLDLKLILPSSDTLFDGIYEVESLTLVHEPDKESMISIPAGPFISGDGQMLSVRTLPSYKIDRYPVTNITYKGYVDTMGVKAPKHWKNGKIPHGKEEHPVVFISYEEADNCAAYYGKRLPTADQWEKAARGVFGRTYPWGDRWDPENCNGVYHLAGGKDFKDLKDWLDWLFRFLACMKTARWS